MKTEITNKSTAGLHAELAAKIVQISSKFDANVVIEYEHITVDAKSILGLISLAVPHGENIKVVAEGTEAEQALNEIKKLLS